MDITGIANRIEADDSESVAKRDVLQLLDQARGLVKSSRRLPFCHRSLVDPDLLIKLLDDTKKALPSNVVLASQVLKRRDKIINQALAEAHRIMVASTDDIDARAQQHSLVAMAEKKAEEIVKQAEFQVRLMMVDAEKQITAPREETFQIIPSIKHRINQFVTLFRGTKNKRNKKS